jgi:tRNA (guanine37-N1)-methyltransferase
MEQTWRFFVINMKFTIITTQSKIFESFLKTGLIARAIAKKIIKIEIINLYDFGIGKHKKIDDSPYGGGAGMILRADVLNKTIKKLKCKNSEVKIILLTPQGKKFTQNDAQRLSQQKNIILISGRFEGFDERIRSLVDEEISIGDYVLTSGDLPAMVLIDAISRQVSGFIDRKESTKFESFSDHTLSPKRYPLLEYPQYTRPYDFKDKKVPKILLSGHHSQIAAWRKKQAILRTQKRRKDLFTKGGQ